MCKEMLVILVDRVVDKKIIIGKMEDQGRGEAQGVADPPKRLFTTGLPDGTFSNPKSQFG
jgi:hypothetical protein